MVHVILLGDSIFDNAPYVPGEPPVIEQLRAELPEDWKATLLAVDGNVTGDVVIQLDRLPKDATHLIISVGGNDALGYADVLERVASMAELGRELEQVCERFRAVYSAMLDETLLRNLPTAVCTIYDQCPFTDARARELIPIALNYFNDVIISEAENRNVHVIELRDLCTEPEDYSELSPIEPSVIGGIKIVGAIIRMLRGQS